MCKNRSQRIEKKFIFPMSKTGVMSASSSVFFAIPPKQSLICAYKYVLKNRKTKFQYFENG